jgi:hypothetical protein
MKYVEFRVSAHQSYDFGQELLGGGEGGVGGQEGLLFVEVQIVSRCDHVQQSIQRGGLYYPNLLIN